MSSAITTQSIGTSLAGDPGGSRPGRLRSGENLVISIALSLLMLLPLADIALRKFVPRGVSGAMIFVQQLTLLIGMLGACIAARENRLLSLSTLGTLLEGRWKTAASLFTGACSASIAALLCGAGFQFVWTERSAGKLLAYGIPAWCVQALLPLGFAALALRLAWHSAQFWKLRAAVALLVAAAIATGMHPPLPAEKLVIPALLLLAVATIIGIPVFTTLGGVALILFWGQQIPVASLSVDHYSMVMNPSLATFPLFTMAGYFLAEGGAPRRFLSVFQALFGSMSGGAAIVTALICAFFTSFTGASGVTIVAIGGLLMPVLLAERYSHKTALGLVTGAGSLGVLLPPCLPLILYGIIARIPINKMFLGGILPGFVMVLAASVWGIGQGRKTGVARRPFEWAKARSALWEAKWELAIPLVVFAALFSGLASPVEAAALTAFYAFLVETVVYRDLSFRKDVTRVMTDCGMLVGGVLLILGVAMGLTNFLVDAEVTARAVEWTTRVIHSRWVFLLVLNLFLLVIGCLMDIYSAIMIQVPLLVPIGAAFGIDPVHLGIIFLANLELGYLTPPVGLNVYMSAYRFKKTVPEVWRAVLPIVAVLFAGVLLITYVPWLTTALPGWLGG